MADFTAKELWDAIRQHQDDDGNDPDYVYNYGYNKGYSFGLPGYGKVETFDIQERDRVVHGEFSGDYTEWEVYFVVEVQGRFFRFSGVDSSWDSVGIDTYEEVEQVQKTVTVWEKKLEY